jgi:hypothetical protein
MYSVEELNPLRIKVYCPESADSFPEPHAALAATMVTLNCPVVRVCGGVLESVTVREKVDVLGAVGVPEIVQLVPEPPMDNHEGNDEPDATLHV